MSQGPNEICTAIDKQMRGGRRLAAVEAAGCYRIVLIDSLWFTPKIVDDAPELASVIAAQRSNIMRSRRHE
jgi:hypothetical protein